ncbi:hypothetical protein [Salinithrix halophila]|uniref:Uncharacterized protein n=1 Tax=Salinithrix halophila TaxID=1485204 RepID=A0ABV8JEJ4_9BACL
MRLSKKMLLVLSLSCVLAVGLCYDVVASAPQHVVKAVFHDEPTSG